MQSDISETLNWTVSRTVSSPTILLAVLNTPTSALSIYPTNLKAKKIKSSNITVTSKTEAKSCEKKHLLLCGYSNQPSKKKKTFFAVVDRNTYNRKKKRINKD